MTDDAANPLTEVEDHWIDGELDWHMEMPYHAFVNSGVAIGGFPLSALGTHCSRCGNREGHPAHGDGWQKFEAADDPWEPLWDAEYQIAVRDAQIVSLRAALDRAGSPQGGQDDA